MGYTKSVIPEHKQAALQRLKTIRGHLDGLIKMVDSEVYCPELMKQVAAVQASLERVNRILLQNHLETCVTEAIQQGGGREKIAELIEALRYNGGLTDFRERGSDAFDTTLLNGHTSCRESSTNKDGETAKQRMDHGGC